MKLRYSTQDKTDLNVCVVGLGSMGFGLASSLLRSGFAVSGFDLKRDVVARFVALGGQGCRKSGRGGGAVEFLFPYDFDAAGISDALQRNNLTLALFNLPPGNWLAGERGLAALSGRRADFRASVTNAMQYAAEIGVGRLHVMSGLAPRNDPAARECYRDFLAYVCDLAGQARLDVLIEPINLRDMPGYFLNDFNYAAELIAELGLANLKLQFEVDESTGRNIAHPADAGRKAFIYQRNPYEAPDRPG
ncbi:MAG: TIM barrel protein [Paracoccaceae bacterium]